MSESVSQGSLFSSDFLKESITRLADWRLIGRALRRLVRKGRLIKIGQGIYARARESLIGGKPILEKGLDTLKEALRRLGVETVPTRFERAYNSGRSEQVPTGRVVAIHGKRIRRRIGYDRVFLSFERASPDRPQKRRKATQPIGTPPSPITAREALQLIWEADRYPIRGNEDWRASAVLTREALDRAATATASPGDPPEFALWLTALQDPSLPEEIREDAMSALHDLFDP